MKKNNLPQKKASLATQTGFALQPTSIEIIYQVVKDILDLARSKAYHAVNAAMLEAYWNIGRIIVEEEQKGKERAEYGEKLVKEISRKLTEDYGKRFDYSNVKRMKQFYLTFQKGDAVRRQLTMINNHALNLNSAS
jgi:hypothetical protein